MTHEMHRYRANGLTLASEIELPELVASQAEPDVVVRFAPVPERLPDATACGPCYQASAGQYLFSAPGIGRYWVKNGREVLIEATHGAPESDIRVFILSSVMGALAHQNGFLAMHASTVQFGDRCVLFAGDSGAGKSTLAAAFVERGYALVADDLCVISFNTDGQAIVHPGYRRLKLWSDSLQQVGAFLGERSLLRVGMRKYSVVAPGPTPHTPLPIATMFVLSNRMTREISLHPLRGRTKVTTLVKETYRRPMMTALGQREEHFDLCARLARCIPVVRVQRPFDLQGLQGLVDALEQHLRVSHEIMREAVS